MKFNLLAIIFVVIGAQLVSAYKPARCDMFCTKEYRPICGVRFYNGKIDSLTHSNSCMYNLYNCQNPAMRYYALQDEGDCIAQGFPPVAITPVKEPVFTIQPIQDKAYLQ